MAKIQFTSPVGRMVFGSVWDGSTTDSKGAARVVKSGPNKGQPSTQWSFGVAFPKVLANGMPNTEFNAFATLIHDAGRAGYPQFFNGPISPITGKQDITPGVVFATKIKDGDGFDTKGQANNQKEGWAGHWIVVFSTQYAPRVFDVNVGLDPTQQLQDKTRVLPGDYIAVNGTVEANTGAETAGVYVNGNMVCFVGGGPRIVSGPKASEAFKGVTAGMMPPGCVVGATPASVAPMPPATVRVPPAPNVPVAPVVMPTPSAPTPVPVPVAPSAPQLTPAAIAAGFTTYQAAIAANWTDDLLRANGYLAPAAPVAPTPPVTPVAPTPPAPVPPAPVPPTPAAPAIQLSPAAIAAGYTLESFTGNGFTYDMMKAGGWAL